MIESNLYCNFGPRFKNYSNLSQYQQKTTDHKLIKSDEVRGSKSLKTSKNIDEAKNENEKNNKINRKNLKRASSHSPNSCSGATSSPKKQRFTPISAKSESPLAVDISFKPQLRTSPVSIKSLLSKSNFNHQANTQMQMMNPMYYYMKTIEDQLKSSQHVCNWMVNNVTCGKKFSTSDQLLSHLQTHAMTSQQPSYPSISSLQTNQMLQSAYRSLQSQQNQLLMQLADKNNSYVGFPMYKSASIYNHNNIASLFSSSSFYYNPLSYVLS